MTKFLEPKLVSPDVERDAPLSVQWINGKEGNNTLISMGNTPSSISNTTLENEQQRVVTLLIKITKELG